MPTGVTWYSIIWWRRLPSGVGICSHPYLPVISVQYIFLCSFSHSHTHSLTASQAIKEQSGGQEDISIWNWVQRFTRSWLVREEVKIFFWTWAFTAWTKWKRVAGVVPSHGWKVSMCYLSVNLFGGQWWGLEIWTLKTFLQFSYDGRIHYKNIYICQYIDFSKEVIYNCHRFLRGGSYICRWLSFELTYKLFTLILNSLHGWGPCFASLRPKTRSLTHKI